jgi:hypothetical protein
MDGSIASNALTPFFSFLPCTSATCLNAPFKQASNALTQLRAWTAVRPAEQSLLRHFPVQLMLQVPQ